MESKSIFIKEAEKSIDRMDFNSKDKMIKSKRGGNKLDIRLDLYNNIIRIIKNRFRKIF